MECIILSSHLTSEKWEAPPFGLVWKINWKMVKKQEKKLNFVRFDLIIIENSYLCQTPSQLDNLEVFHGKLMNWRIIISHHLSAGSWRPLKNHYSLEEILLKPDQLVFQVIVSLDTIRLSSLDFCKSKSNFNPN